MDIDVKSLGKKMTGLRGTDNYDKASRHSLQTPILSSAKIM